jgi:hypothetical protein
MKLLGLLRADADSEAGVPPSADLISRMGDFIEEVTKAGVLLAADGLKPTSEGKRVKLENGKLTVTDGPFTESKELVASYALYQVDSYDQAVYWTKRFLEVLGGGEVEIRPIFEATDFPEEVFTPEEREREERTRAAMEQNAR